MAWNFIREGNSPWPERDPELTQLWNEGELSTKQIGEKMNLTKNCIVGRAHRIGLPNKGSPIKRAAVPGQPKAPPPCPLREKPAPLLSCFVPPVPVGKVQPCCWVTSSGRPWLYCDEPSIPGKVYCQSHQDVAYVGRTRQATGAIENAFSTSD